MNQCADEDLRARVAELCSSGGPIFRYVRRLGAGHHDTENITQDTAEAALASLGSRRKNELPAAYVYTIARNKYYQLFRKKKEILVGDYNDVEPPVQDSPSDWREAALDDCLQRLGKESRMMLWEVHIAGSSCRELAKVLGRSEDAVFKQLQRKRKTLADCIRGKLGLLP